MIILRSIGALTIVATVALMAVGLFSRGAAISTFLVYVGIGAICLGLMTMIVHLNFSRVVSKDEKDEWRRHLWWGGPFVAGWYLWSAPRTRGPSAKRERPRVLVTVSVSVLIATMAVISAIVVEPVRVEFAGNDVFETTIRYGSIVSGSVVGAVIAAAFRLPLRWTFGALMPSWMLIVWQTRTNGLETARSVALLCIVGLTLICLHRVRTRCEGTQKTH